MKITKIYCDSCKKEIGEGHIFYHGVLYAKTESEQVFAMLKEQISKDNIELYFCNECGEKFCSQGER